MSTNYNYLENIIENVKSYRKNKLCTQNKVSVLYIMLLKENY